MESFFFSKINEFTRSEEKLIEKVFIFPWHSCSENVYKAVIEKLREFCSYYFKRYVQNSAATQSLAAMFKRNIQERAIVI